MMRYTATICFDINAENDVQAFRRIDRMIRKTDKKYDNKPMLITLESTPFGSLITREINLDDVKASLKAANSVKAAETL